MRNALWVLKTLIRNQLVFVGETEKRTLEIVAPFSLLGVARLRSLWTLANSIVDERVTGSFIECGCWNGGSGALLARVASRAGRSTSLFDSFEGLPAPTAQDVTGWGELGKEGDFVGSLAKVQEVLALAGVPESAVWIVKGWFQDTLTSAATGPIALLHIDVDWHDSTATVLGALWDRVTPGGILVIDDYGFWQGLKKAVDGFFAGLGERPTIHHAAYPSVWIRKPAYGTTKPERSERRL